MLERRSHSRVMSEEQALGKRIANLPVSMTTHVNNAVTGLVLPIITPKKYEKRKELLDIISNLHDGLKEIFMIAKMKKSTLEPEEYRELCKKVDLIRTQYPKQLDVFCEMCSATLKSNDRQFLDRDQESYMELLHDTEAFAEKNQVYLTVKRKDESRSPTVSSDVSDDERPIRPSSAVRSKPKPSDNQSSFNRPQSVAASLFDPELRDAVLKRSRDAPNHSNTRIVAERTRVELTLADTQASSRRSPSQKKAPIGIHNDSGLRQKGLDDHALDKQIKQISKKKQKAPTNGK